MITMAGNGSVTDVTTLTGNYASNGGRLAVDVTLSQLAGQREAMERASEEAEREGIHFTVVGPEAPLAAGIVDLFRSKGLRIFGPTKAAAQLESSKDFAKAFMHRHGIPTAYYKTFANNDAAVNSAQWWNWNTRTTPADFAWMKGDAKANLHKEPCNVASGWWMPKTAKGTAWELKFFQAACPWSLNEWGTWTRRFTVMHKALTAAGVRAIERWPLYVYARYPFTVLYNDQFDRFSAPIEKRYSPDEVTRMLTAAGLTNVSVRPCFGWVADGTRPLQP